MWTKKKDENMCPVCKRLFHMRRRWTLAVTLAAVLTFTFSAIHLMGPSAVQDVRVYDFEMTPSMTRMSRQQQVEEHLPFPSPFKQIPNLQIYLYSAVANDQEPVTGDLNLIITAFDSTGTDSLMCCMVESKKKKLYTSQATVFHKYYIEEILGSFLELFKNAPTKAKQYACVMPGLGLQVSHVTLTATKCPLEEEQYLPVVYPRSVPQGLVLCAKSAFGKDLDPQKLMEWFEVQRLLGVDHIQLMDLDNPDPIQKIFQYYTEMGLLSALPYQLPGPPWHRGLDWEHWVRGQVSHDETLPILDCKQRQRGYTYIISHDMDEVIMPRRHITIKELLKEQFMLKPDAAGFYFYTEFFVYEWGPRNTDSNITYFRYLTSTEPHDECKKYAFLNSRVHHARTHSFKPRRPHRGYFMDKEDAILHHYRKCPQVWSTCNPPQIVDESMLRFKGVLDERLNKARKATGLYPKT